MKTFISMTVYIRRHLPLWLMAILVPPLASLFTNLYFAGRLEAFTAGILQPRPSFRQTAVMLAVSIPVLLLFSGIDDIGRYCFSLLTASVDNSIKQELYSKITKAPLTNLQSFQKGELVARYGTDAEQTAAIVANDVQGFFYPLTVGIGYLIAVLHTDIRIGSLMAFLGAAVIVLNFLFLKRLLHIQRELLQAGEEYVQNCSNGIRGKMSLRQYDAGKFMADRIEASAETIRQKELALASLQALKALTCDGLANICTCLLTPFSCLLAAFGFISLPAVVFIHQICRVFIQYTQNFANAFVQLQRHSLSFQRLNSVMALPVEDVESDIMENILSDKDISPDKDPPLCRNISLGKGISFGRDIPPGKGISFENVSVSYGEHKVLDGASFSIHPGEIVCLTGESGSGKTTLIKALLQMVDYLGTISIDGTDVKSLPLSVLRKQIGFSPEQGGGVFPETVYENVRFGSLKATADEIYLAMEQASLHEQPAFGQRSAGENGSLLSGGQRQKVSLARALLKNAPILILDEPTAALDKESETEVLETIQDLKHQGKSILIITHKATTLQAADRAICIEHGTVTELDLFHKHHSVS